MARYAALLVVVAACGLSCVLAQTVDPLSAQLGLQPFDTSSSLLEVTTGTETQAQAGVSAHTQLHMDASLAASMQDSLSRSSIQERDTASAQSALAKVADAFALASTVALHEDAIAQHTNPEELKSQQAMMDREWAELDKAIDGETHDEEAPSFLELSEQESRSASSSQVETDLAHASEALHEALTQAGLSESDFPSVESMEVEDGLAQKSDEIANLYSMHDHDGDDGIFAAKIEQAHDDATSFVEVEAEVDRRAKTTKHKAAAKAKHPKKVLKHVKLMSWPETGASKMRFREMRSTTAAKSKSKAKAHSKAKTHHKAKAKHSIEEEAPQSTPPSAVYEDNPADAPTTLEPRFAQTQALAEAQMQAQAQVGTHARRGFFGQLAQTAGNLIGKALGHGPNSKGKRPQDIEDCCGCRFIWAQVEQDVGSARFVEDVQASFEHNCMDAQKSTIFYSVCEDMYDDMYALTDDYMANEYDVDKICTRANICGNGKASR